MRNKLMFVVPAILLACGAPVTTPTVPGPVGQFKAAPAAVSAELAKQVAVYHKILRADEKAVLAQGDGGVGQISFAISATSTGTQVTPQISVGGAVLPFNAELRDRLVEIYSKVKAATEKA